MKNRSIFFPLLILFAISLGFLVFLSIYIIHKNNININELNKIYEDFKFKAEWKENQTQRLINNIIEKGMKKEEKRENNEDE